jgi:hypothetical protein
MPRPKPTAYYAELKHSGYLLKHFNSGAPLFYANLPSGNRAQDLCAADL